MSVDELLHTYSVSELGREIGVTLESRFANDVWVQGEIRGLSRSRNEHVYFELAEPDDARPGGAPLATLSVTLFAGTRRIVNTLLKRAAGGVRMEDGMRVRIRGVVTFYPPSGRLQFRMTSIDPSFTLSQLAADRERVLRALAADGLLGRNGELALPAVPLRLGLVTAIRSAAYEDVLAELGRHGLAWRVQHVDAQVQGARAEAAVCAALTTLARRGVDAIALVRGGGSRADLAVFDSEALARCIAGLDVPVLTGIGHEIDRSIADEVAHTCCKTPTAVAALLNERVLEFVAACDDAWASISTRAGELVDEHDDAIVALAHRSARATRAQLDRHDTHTRHLATRIGRETMHAVQHADRRLDRHLAAVSGAGRRGSRQAERQLADAARRLAGRAPRLLATADRRLDGDELRVRALDPVRILARGWSVTRTTDGRTVRSAADVAPGDALVTLLADGVVTSTVTEAPTTDPNGSTR